MAFLTVFTPAYNRAHTLPRTYESLCQQDCKDFIWLIVDDGSTDETADLVKGWKKEKNGFEIQYIYKENVVSFIPSGNPFPIIVPEKSASSAINPA